MWQAHRVIEHHRDEGALFSGPPKRGPVARYWSIEIELAAIGRHVRADRRGALGGGKDNRDSISLPRRAVDLDPASPQIDHGTALEVDTNTRAEFVAMLEVFDECIQNSLEPGITFALDLPRADILRNH